MIVEIDLTEVDPTVEKAQFLETKIPKQIPLNAGTETL